MRALTEWLDWGRRTRGWADTTCYDYQLRTGHWLTWTKDNGIRADRATPADIEDWLATLHPSPSVRTYATVALVAYYDWQESRTRRPNPARKVPRVPRSRSIPRSLSPDQVKAVRAAASRHGPDWALFVALMLYAGLRRVEACRVRWVDVEGADEWLRVIGKGGKERVLPIHSELRAALVRWRSAGMSPEWVFPGRYRGEHMSTSCATKRTRQILDEAGVPQATGHWCRHTYGTVALERSGDIAAVQGALRHESLSSTSIYTQARPARVAEVVAMLDY